MTATSAELRDNYNQWIKPPRVSRLSRLDLKDRGVQLDALHELDRASDQAAQAAWAAKWGREALSALTGRNL